MSDKQFKNVAIEREDGITFVMLNRPEKRNAMSPELHYEMEDALDWLATDKETKVLVLARRGRSLVRRPGPAALFPRHRRTIPRSAQGPMRRAIAGAGRSSRRFPSRPSPWCNGYCFGGAFTQLCACDFAITAEDATYGLSEVNWGIIPGGIVSWNLTDMMLPRHALYLRGHRRDLRRQARGRDRPRELRRAEGEAARGDGQARAKADEAQSRRGALHQGSDPRRARHDRTSRRATTCAASRIRSRATTRKSATRSA